MYCGEREGCDVHVPIIAIAAWTHTIKLKYLAIRLQIYIQKVRAKPEAIMLYNGIVLKYGWLNTYQIKVNSNNPAIISI